MDKISEKNIAVFTGMFGAKVEATDIARSVFANSLSFALTNTIGSVFGQTAKAITVGTLKLFELKGAVINKTEAANAAEEQSISILEKKNELQSNLNDLIEKQAELSSAISDRDKDSVSSMAAKARQILHQKSPTERLHTVTPAARLALQVDTLEQRAKIAAQYQNRQGESQRLQAEADRIRKNPVNAWAFKRADQDPMHKTEFELQQVNMKLAPVARMAELVNSQSDK